MPVILPPSRAAARRRGRAAPGGGPASASALAISGTVAALLEIADRALAAALVGRLAGEPQDAERARTAARPAARPRSRAGSSRRRRTSAAAPCPRRRRPSSACVVHLRLHRPPVGDRGADVGEHAVELGDQLGADLGVGAVDLDIHDRFAPAPCRRRAARPPARPPLSSRVTQTTGWSRRWMIRPRAAIASAIEIDQERHVVVDDADPHPPLAELGAGRFEPDRARCRAAGGRRRRR